MIPLKFKPGDVIRQKKEYEALTNFHLLLILEITPNYHPRATPQALVVDERGVRGYWSIFEDRWEILQKDDDDTTTRP
jgi:hypothetical protein